MEITQDQINAREALLSKCPIIGVWGESGAGKTTFIASIMDDPRYRKALFIDGDKGGETVAHITDRPELCDYRQAKGTNAHAAHQWLCREIAMAHKVPDINAIVIEGIARTYEDLVGENFATVTPDKLNGYALQQLYNVPSQLVKAVFAMINNLQSQLQSQGRALPVFVTINSKTVRDDKAGTSWQIPGISDSATKIMMARASAFIQIQRIGRNVSLLTDRDQNTNARKVRHHAAAQAIAKLRNPSAVTMIQTWADAIANDSAAVNEHLST